MAEAIDPNFREAREVLEALARAGEATAREAKNVASGVGQIPPAANATAPQHWAEQTLRGFLESLPDALVVINREGFIVLVNTCTEQMFGYRREELLGQAIELLVPERFRKGHVQKRTSYFTAPMTRPMGAALELFGRRRDGAEFPVEISLSPLATEHGLLVTGVIRDVSKRKRDEAKFRTMVETIPAVTFIAPLDESAPEFYVSPQIEHLLGFSQKEWLEDPVLWHRQLHPDDKERWNREFAPTCAAGTPFQSIYRFIAKDGRVVWVHGSAQMVRDAEGRPIFLQGIAFDVTVIKDAEAALARMNAELESRVLERTEELDLSLKELREKSEELEQFAYVASHDLREPLRTLVNYPQRLTKHYGETFNEQANDWIGRIINGAERMRRLIDSLSHYSRVLRRDRKFAPLDLRTVLAEACSNLQAAIEESGAELALAELPTLTGNQQQLMLLFQNLIGNAIKFRDPARQPRVEVGCQRRDAHWLFWVRDNGIGVEEKHLKRIFGLGERLHPPSRYPGTGFGLAICEKIVGSHGGTIWAESELGQGSVFSFTLPDGTPDERQATPTAAPS